MSDWEKWIVTMLRGKRSSWDWNILYYPCEGAEYLCLTKGYFGTDYEAFYFCLSGVKKDMLNPFDWQSERVCLQGRTLEDLIERVDEKVNILLPHLERARWEKVEPKWLWEDKEYYTFEQPVPYVLTWNMIRIYIQKYYDQDITRLPDWPAFYEKHGHSALLLTKERLSLEDEYFEELFRKDIAWKTVHLSNLLAMLVSHRIILPGAYLIGP